jgi:hypothetical protein
MPASRKQLSALTVASSGFLFKVRDRALHSGQAHIAGDMYGSGRTKATRGDSA